MSLRNVQITGLVVGVIGFVIPLLIEIPGLTLAGSLALSIFLMAAVFWMFEPIPIHATSLLVIFLQILLLSGQGFIFAGKELPATTPEAAGQQHWKVPDAALSEEGTLFLVRDDGTTDPRNVRVIERDPESGSVTLEAPFLYRESRIAADASHPLAEFNPHPYSDFMGTLADPIIILFLGGFVLAGAAVKYKLDRNLTRILLRPFGERPGFIILGLMAVTALLSAFMSNTATTAMMMTVIIPIISQTSEGDPVRIGLALSIPFAANIGGVATPIGTPPNAIVLANLAQQGINISFGYWMVLALPLVLIMLFVAWVVLRWFFPPDTHRIEVEMNEQFNTSNKAYILYGVFLLTVLLWITSSLHGISSTIVALLPVVGLTLTQVLEKEDIRSLPWEVLWLMAGGISLGISMENTGLALWMINQIGWGAMSVTVLFLIFGLVALVLSNFISNTVTASLVVPLAITTAMSDATGGFSMIILVLVVGVSASMAMVLPISTPPNAIAMSTDMLRTNHMAKAGTVIGIIGIMVTLAYALFYWPILF